MSMVAAIWSAWGLVVLFLVALKVYTWRLNRDEDDTIYLDDALAQEKAAQEEIIAKAGKIAPLVRIAVWLVIIMSIVVFAYYVYDTMVHLDIIH